MDMLQWWADNSGRDIPVTYEGTGKWAPNDLYNATSHWDVGCTYNDGLPMRFMDRVTALEKRLHPGIAGGDGTLFVGSEGWVRVARNSWATSSVELKRKAKTGEKRLIVSKDQIQNFVDCVLSRETPVDDLHSAVRSDVATHLANIAVRTKRAITWDPKQEVIVGDPDAAKMASRSMRNPWSL